MITSLLDDDKAYGYLLFCRYAYMIPSVLHERYWFGNVDPWRAGWYTVTSLISENFLTVCITRTYNLRQLYSVPSKSITIWNLYLDFTGIFCASCATPLYCIRHSKTSCIVTRRHFCSPNHRWTGDLSPDKVGSSSFGWKICLCEAYGRPTLGCPSDIMSREPQTPSTSDESERKFTESSTRKMGFAKSRKQHKKKQQRAGRKPAGSLLGHLHKAGRSLFFLSRKILHITYKIL